MKKNPVQVSSSDPNSKRVSSSSSCSQKKREKKRKKEIPNFWRAMINSRRDYRSNRAALFDGIEEGGIRASSSYTTHEIDELDNEMALDGLQDRVNVLKRLTGDIHGEVESHNRLLDLMGNDMDASRGVLSGTMDRFKTVFETKSGRRMVTLVTSFVILFLLIYFLTK